MGILVPPILGSILTASLYSTSRPAPREVAAPFDCALYLSNRKFMLRSVKHPSSTSAGLAWTSRSMNISPAMTSGSPIELFAAACPPSRRPPAQLRQWLGHDYHPDPHGKPDHAHQPLHLHCPHRKHALPWRFARKAASALTSKPSQFGRPRDSAPRPLPHRARTTRAASPLPNCPSPLPASGPPRRPLSKAPGPGQRDRPHANCHSPRWRANHTFLSLYHKPGPRPRMDPPAPPSRKPNPGRDLPCLRRTLAGVSNTSPAGRTPKF